MLKKTTTLLFAIFLFQFVTSCDDCNCGKVSDFEFIYEGFELATFRLNEESELTEDESFNRDNFFIKLAFLLSEAPSSQFSLNGFGFNAASACDCVVPRFIYDENIADIDLFLVNDEENLNVSSLFLVQLENDSLTDLDEYIVSLPSNRSECARTEELLLVYNGGDLLDAPFEIEVVLTFSSGEAISRRTAVLTFEDEN